MNCRKAVTDASSLKDSNLRGVRGVIFCEYEKAELGEIYFSGRSVQQSIFRALEKGKKMSGGKKKKAFLVFCLF